ncbi:MAG TPA: type II secretion system F family protein [Dehalococcoidia bacterium]|nr:type II secretion system F family protein [Dehalococcoidia bacterium]
MEFLAAFTIAGALFLFAVYAIRSRSLRPTDARLLNLADSVPQQVSDTEQRFLRQDASGIPAVRRFLASRGYADRWAFDLERAGVKMRAGEYFLMRAVLGMVTLLLFAVIGRNALALLVGILAGFIMFMLPAFWLDFAVKRRIGAIDKQLVEAVTLIAGALRSGFAFSQALDVAADRLGPPISIEFNRVLLDVNLGASTEEALRALNARLASDDVDMVVTAILIQRNTGGNLAEVLDSVTETMRDRERLLGEIRTLTAHQQLTGWVLSIYPIVLAGVFFLISPNTTKLLWTTGPGFVLLVIWGILNISGIFAVRRILNIDI